MRTLVLLLVLANLSFFGYTRLDASREGEANHLVSQVQPDKIKLLTVAVDRLKTWHRPGLLCIGDAAHAMSPVGGVGVNLAVQDAVATANILAQALKERRVTAELLAAVETRRSLPMRVIQRLQVFVHNRVLTRVLASRGRIAPPWPVKLLNRFPLLRRLPAYIIGIGVRPEHIRTSASAP